MQQVRPWQIVLFVAAVGAMAFGLWWSLGRGPRAQSTNRTLLVDVTNGELFEFSTKKRGVVIPERNPETGKIALFPVRQDENGEWVIEARYLGEGSLAEVEGEPEMLGPEGRVRVASGQPKKIGAKRN